MKFSPTERAAEIRAKRLRRYLSFNGAKKELSEGFVSTTNNRMEILAAVKGLEALKEKCDVTLYSDSKYLVDSVNLGWLKNGAKTTGCAQKAKRQKTSICLNGFTN